MKSFTFLSFMTIAVLLEQVAQATMVLQVLMISWLLFAEQKE